MNGIIRYIHDMNQISFVKRERGIGHFHLVGCIRNETVREAGYQYGPLLKILLKKGDTLVFGTLRASPDVWTVPTASTLPIRRKHATEGSSEHATGGLPGPTTSHGGRSALSAPLPAHQMTMGM